MNIGTALRGAHFLVKTGSDLLRDDLAPHVTTAVEQTATEHADALGEASLASADATPPDASDLPAFVEDDALPPEESGAFVITTLLYEALETPELERELDGLTDKGETVGREILAAELEAEASADLVLDFEAVAKDFCRYLGRALSSDGDLSRKYLISLVQDIREKMDGETDATATALEVLVDQGFEILDDTAIENRDTNLEFCWRRSFTFTEIREDYPIERDWPGDEYDRVTDVLLANAAEGSAVALVSPPGAGKTTTTRMAAIEWYDRHDDGVVAYHQGRDPVTDADALTDALQSIGANRPVLVVIEDAARSGVEPFYRTLYDVEPNENVSVLLNSREREWEGFDDQMSVGEECEGKTQASREFAEIRKRYVTRRNLPEIGTSEIERLKDRFEELTGKTVTASPEELAEQIHADHGTSPMLLLSYHLPIGDIEVQVDEETSALESNVREVYDRITDPSDGRFSEMDDDLLADVSLLANVLNAAELPIAREYLYALSGEEDEFEAIDEMREAFDGVLFFGMSEDGQHWSHHSLWSELYLQRHLDTATSVKSAREQFEDVVNELFRFLEDEESRTAIGKSIGRTTSLLRAHNDHPEILASGFAEAVFEIGENRPRLSPLFSTTDYSGISLPETCPASTHAISALYRHRMYRIQGEHEVASEELEAFCSLADEGTDSKFTDAIYFNEQGKMAQIQGDFEGARVYHSMSLALARVHSDRASEAKFLGNLGLVARNQGDFEGAQEYHTKSLAIARDLDDQDGRATSLNNLGLVARNLGDFERAREYHTKSLAIKRDLGDRASEAKILGNLGLVAQCKEDFERAREYYEQSLAIKRDLGDRTGEAASLCNLGVVARHQADLEEAKKYHEQSLAIALDIDDQAGGARSLANLGSIVSDQGAFDTAAEYFEKAHTVFRHLGAVREELGMVSNLISTQLRAGNEDAAVEWCDRGLERCGSLDIDVAEYVREFHRLRAGIVENAEQNLDSTRETNLSATPDLREDYRAGLQHVVVGDGHQATNLLLDVWDAWPTVPDTSEAASHVLAGGVALAVLVRDDPALASIHDEVHEAVGPRYDQLPEPARPLADALLDTASDDQSLPRSDADADDELAEYSLETVEQLAFARLYSRIQ